VLKRKSHNQFDELHAVSAVSAAAYDAEAGQDIVMETGKPPSDPESKPWLGASLVSKLLGS
jgi:hypothetical protein